MYTVHGVCRDPVTHGGPDLVKTRFLYRSLYIVLYEGKQYKFDFWGLSKRFEGYLLSSKSVLHDIWSVYSGFKRSWGSVGTPLHVGGPPDLVKNTIYSAR